MLDWWLGLPSWLRIGLGLVLLLTGGGLILAGMTGYLVDGEQVFPRYSLIFVALGFAMVMFGGKSASERNGYNF